MSLGLNNPQNRRGFEPGRQGHTITNVQCRLALALRIVYTCPHADRTIRFGGDEIINRRDVGATAAAIGLGPVLGPFATAIATVVGDAYVVLTAACAAGDCVGIGAGGSDGVGLAFLLDGLGVGYGWHLAAPLIDFDCRYSIPYSYITVKLF